MEEERDEYMCPSCGEMRDIEEMCNKDGACDHCNSEKCPDCGSFSVGFDNGEYECFDCDYRW